MRDLILMAGRWLIALAGALTFAAPGVAQDTTLQSAPVVIANRTIIILRGPIAGYTAQERATNSIRRIEEYLESDPNAEVTFAEADGATRVLVGGEHAFLVTKVDIDAQAGETTLIVAQEAGRRLRMAITEWREQTSPRYLAVAAGVAAGATLVYALLLWMLYRAGRWLVDRAAVVAESRARLMHLGNVHVFTRRLLSTVLWVVAVVVTTIWLAFVLERFPYTRAWGENLADNLFGIAKHVALAIASAVPGLLLVIIIALLARVVLGAARVLFDRAESGRGRIKWLDPDTVRPTRRIFTFVVWIFALAVAYPYLPGANTDAFKGLSVLIGVMISLGGASIFGQAFSGLILMYMRAFRKGDYVRIGETEGTISELGMFATRIRTGLGEEITLPNATVMATSTKNYSRVHEGVGYVVDTAVTIGYNTPWRQVHAMLEAAARRTPDIAETPAPFVRQTALSDFYVEYRLVAYSLLESATNRADLLNRLHGSIQDVFNEHGVQIMSPNYEADPDEPHVVPKENWYLPPAKPPAKG